MSASTHPNYSPGLEGVIAGTTQICHIDSDRSQLIYRGYDVHDLAKNGTYEETVYLLFNGKLPDVEELAELNERLGEERTVPKQIYSILKELPKETHPMDMVRTAYSALAAFDPDYKNSGHDANVRKALRIVAKAGAIIANAHRIRLGKEVVQPDPKLGTAANFLYMLNGETADDKTVKVMDTSLTLYAEHGYNASTFANRVTVSTLSDLYSGVVTGIGTLRGPLHGGANEEAMKMLLEIGEPEDAERWILDALEQKKKIMGFGHREYKHGDSRAFIMSQVAKQLGRKMKNTKFGEIADTLERVMREKKGLFPNVDFPSAYAYYLLGIPLDLYTPIFVLARVAGYTAHAIEQLDNNRLIRPTVIYEGPVNMPYVKLESR